MATVLRPSRRLFLWGGVRALKFTLGGLGAYLGASGAVLGASCAVLRGFSATFSQLGAILAQSFVAKPLCTASVRPLTPKITGLGAYFCSLFDNKITRASKTLIF